MACVVRARHFDVLILRLSNPDGTELREANALCVTEAQNADGLASPVKRYISRLTGALKRHVVRIPRFGRKILSRGSFYRHGRSVILGSELH
jgi:hypothetical protein